MFLLCFIVTILVPAMTSGPGVAKAEPTVDTAQRDGRDNLAKELDELVTAAQKKAKAVLPENVTSAEQARKTFAGRNVQSYCVREHKGWWVVALKGSRSEPVLCFSGAAIRKNSKDIYYFGGW